MPVFTSYVILWRYMVDLPFIDDYPTILHFSVKYLNLPTAGQRFHYILADQYVEYKLVLLHLITVAELALTHRVSFAVHFWIGNIALLPLAYVLWRTYRATDSSTLERLALFLPIAFILFSMNYAEALDWAAPSIGYIVTTTLCLSSICLLTESSASPNNWKTAAASLLAFSAYLLSANAYLLLPIALYLFIKRRAFGWIAVWCVLFVLSTVPYFVFFVKDTRPGSGPMWLIPLWFVAFVGSASVPLRLAFPLGILVLALYGTSFRSGFRRSHPAAFWAMTWLLASAAMAAVGRGRTGIPFALVSRYKFFSNLFLIFCYGYLVECIRATSITRTMQRRLYATALALSILFCIRSDRQGAKILRDRRALLLAGINHYREDTQHSPMWFNNLESDHFFDAYAISARQDVIDAERMGIYSLSKAPIK